MLLVKLLTHITALTLLATHTFAQTPTFGLINSPPTLHADQLLTRHRRQYNEESLSETTAESQPTKIPKANGNTTSSCDSGYTNCPIFGCVEGTKCPDICSKRKSSTDCVFSLNGKGCRWVSNTCVQDIQCPVSSSGECPSGCQGCGPFQCLIKGLKCPTMCNGRSQLVCNDGTLVNGVGCAWNGNRCVEWDIINAMPLAASKQVVAREYASDNSNSQSTASQQSPSSSSSTSNKSSSHSSKTTSSHSSTSASTPASTSTSTHGSKSSSVRKCHDGEDDDDGDEEKCDDDNDDDDEGKCDDDGDESKCDDDDTDSDTDDKNSNKGKDNNSTKHNNHTKDNSKTKDNNKTKDDDDDDDVRDHEKGGTTYVTDVISSTVFVKPLTELPTQPPDNPTSSDHKSSKPTLTDKDGDDDDKKEDGSYSPSNSKEQNGGSSTKGIGMGPLIGIIVLAFGIVGLLSWGGLYFATKGKKRIDSSPSNYNTRQLPIYSPNRASDPSTVNLGYSGSQDGSRGSYRSSSRGTRASNMPG